MRYTQSEKMQIIRLVENSLVSIKQTLLELNINRSGSVQNSVSRYGFQVRYNDQRRQSQF